jgi:hypothetical protein
MEPSFQKNNEASLERTSPLIEEEFGERPPPGLVVLGDESRVGVENTEWLRSQVFAVELSR